MMTERSQTLPFQINEATIQDLITAIIREAQPRAVALFGSRARGDDRPASDVDLLVVMPDGTNTRASAIDLENHLAHVPLAFDLIVATPKRLAAARGDFSSVLHW